MSILFSYMIVVIRDKPSCDSSNCTVLPLEHNNNRGGVRARTACIGNVQTKPSVAMTSRDYKQHIILITHMNQS